MPSPARTSVGPPVHLSSRDLADRWNTSPGHLANLRSKGEGAPYLKLGARVVYPLAAVEAYEAARLVEPTAA